MRKGLNQKPKLARVPNEVALIVSDFAAEEDCRSLTVMLKKLKPQDLADGWSFRNQQPAWIELARKHLTTLSGS